MISLILWSSGVLTTISIGFGVYFFLKFKSTKQLLQFTTDLLKKTQSELKEKTSRKRIAKFTTTGWNFTDGKHKDFPNGWKVYFELKEVAVSEDETKTKFEVTSVISENTSDPWLVAVNTGPGLHNYINWFNSNTGGGWVKNDSPELEWITNLSKSEARDMKLKDLGID